MNKEWNVINERKEPAEAKAVYAAEHKGIGGSKIRAFGALFNFWDRIKLSRRHMGDGKIGFNPPENPDVGILWVAVRGSTGSCSIGTGHRTYIYFELRWRDGHRFSLGVGLQAGIRLTKSSKSSTASFALPYIW